jgi:uncharacterized protein YqiB (DUF1249 family)
MERPWQKSRLRKLRGPNRPTATRWLRPWSDRVASLTEPFGLLPEQVSILREKRLKLEKTMIYEKNYKKLLHLIPDLETASFEARKLKADGFMDLNIDMLYKEEDRTVMALSHYYKHPSGDMIPDPDMEIAVYPERKMVEALSYQDTFGYRTVYPEENQVNPRAKKELNAFLSLWLANLISQGHR